MSIHLQGALLPSVSSPTLDEPNTTSLEYVDSASLIGHCCAALFVRNMADALSNRGTKLLELRTDLDRVYDMLSHVISKDSETLKDLDAIIRLCEQTLQIMDRPKPAQFSFETLEAEYDTEGSGEGLFRVLAEDGSQSATTSPNSMSVLGARELFPDTPTSSRTSQCSSPSPRTHFMRSIKDLREDNVQTMLLDIKGRMKRRRSV